MAKRNRYEKRINEDLRDYNAELRDLRGKVANYERQIREHNEAIRKKNERLQEFEEELRQRENRSIGDTVKLRLATLKEQRDTARNRSKRMEILLRAIWRRIESEYPHGGFPDMGMLEDELRFMGVI